MKVLWSVIKEMLTNLCKVEYSEDYRRYIHSEARVTYTPEVEVPLPPPVYPMGMWHGSYYDVPRVEERKTDLQKTFS